MIHSVGPVNIGGRVYDVHVGRSGAALYNQMLNAGPRRQPGQPAPQQRPQRPAQARRTPPRRPAARPAAPRVQTPREPTAQEYAGLAAVFRAALDAARIDY